VDLEFLGAAKIYTLPHFPIPKNGWTLKKTGGVKNTKYYPCCKEPYPDITFNLTVTRRSTYLVVVYIYPVVIVAFVSPSMFLIPYHIPGKVLFGLLVLLVEVIQLMMINLVLPGHRVNTPIVVWVYLYNMAMTTVSLFFTLVTINLSAIGFCARPVPNFIRKFLLDNAIGRLCGVSEKSVNCGGFDNPLYMSSIVRTFETHGAGALWSTIVEHCGALKHMELEHCGAQPDWTDIVEHNLIGQMKQMTCNVTFNHLEFWFQRY
ncbi:unnamed protein product, partial [Owenia fusiformis]